MPVDSQIDNLDKKILSHLIHNGRKAYSEIAQELIVSPGTIHVRMKKLEKMGVVKGTALIVDPKRLGFDLTAYIGVYFEKGGSYDRVLPELKQIEEIVEAHYTTGVYGIFAKVVCSNTDHLRSVLSEKVQQVPGIMRTETIISLEQCIHRQVNI